jgi:hypothetical protein
MLPHAQHMVTFLCLFSPSKYPPSLLSLPLFKNCLGLLYDILVKYGPPALQETPRESYMEMVQAGLICDGIGVVWQEADVELDEDMARAYEGLRDSIRTLAGLIHPVSDDKIIGFYLCICDYYTIISDIFYHACIYCIALQ